MNELLIAIIPFVLLISGLIFVKAGSHIVTSSVALFSIILLSLSWDVSGDIVVSSVLSGLFFALIPILWVVFAGLFSFHVIEKTGRLERIKSFLLSLSDDKNVGAVLLVFSFGALLESFAGFGTSVIIPALMLVSLGFKPVKAAIASLVANSVPVAFGALGLPVIVLGEVTSLPADILAIYVSYQLVLFSLILPFVLYIIFSGTFRNSFRGYMEIGIIAFSFAFGQMMTALFIGPELVSVIAALFSMIAYSIYAMTRKDIVFKGLFTSTLPYTILIMLALLSIVFSDLLNLIISYGTFSVNPITTSGTLLITATLLSALILKIRWGVIKESLKDTLYKIRFSAITIISIVILAKFLSASGATDILSVFIIGATGVLYPFFAPFIGALGTFITGSDASSNILFGELQKDTALSLDGNTEWLVASNTSGATAGKMISPQSISLASSSLGIKEESSLMRTMLPYCIAYLLLLGIIVFIFF